MKNSAQHRSWTLNPSFRPASAALAIAFVFALVTVLTQSAQAQTFTVLHNFTNGADGGEPWAGLSMDRAGNLYGTASTGGNSSGACSYRNPPGCGTVFKLSRKGSGWVFTPIYTFSGPDGASPMARVIIGPDGSLYGTTIYGGGLSYGSDPAMARSSICGRRPLPAKARSAPGRKPYCIRSRASPTEWSPRLVTWSSMERATSMAPPLTAGKATMARSINSPRPMAAGRKPFFTGSRAALTAPHPTLVSSSIAPATCGERLRSAGAITTARFTS